MLNYQKIRTLLENKNVSKMNFYKEIGMTSAGFDRMLTVKTMKVETLEKIAAYFNKPISYFFDEKDVQENDGIYKDKYIGCLEENIKLRSQIDNLKENDNIPKDKSLRKLK